MDYSQARKYIDSLRTRGIVPGLENINKLCETLGNPQNKLRVIHIAGTNGKGSTGVFIESILRSAGKNVFRFSSPAVGNYLEMFSINGKNAVENDYALCAELIRNSEYDSHGSLSFTVFEAETAIAFMLAKKYSPDYAIIECGLGGRLDSTNIINNPVLSVITAISKDHTAFLGDTISEIAFEKCGIIKNQAPVVSATQQEEAEKVIQKVCCEQGSKLSYMDIPYDIDYSSSGTTFYLKKNQYSIRLFGSFQPLNAALAAKAAETLRIEPEYIRRGLKNAYIPYRFERIGRFILDGAHNPDAVKRLSESVRIYLNNGKTAFICGIFKDKDYESISEITAKLADKVFTVSPPLPRGLDSKELCRIFKKHGANALSCETMKTAIDKAIDMNYDNILIFGSLSILAEAKEIIISLNNERDQQ